MYEVLPYTFICVLGEFFYITNREWYYYTWLPLLAGYIYIDKTSINVHLINYVIIILVANHVSGYYWSIVPVLGYIATNI